MLKKVISIILILISIIILFYNKKELIDAQEDIDKVIINNNINRKYDGYMNIPSIDKTLLIKKGNYEDILNNNLVLMISSIDVLNNDYGNIILAGHNNKYVFNCLYKLKIDDEIIISDFINSYSFTVYNIDTVKVEDTYILDNIYNEKILTLITCTNNNQTRYIVRAKFNHIISHN